MTLTPPTEDQKRIAALLGVNVADDSQRVAAARIREVVESAIHPGAHYRPATEPQIEFAESLGLVVKGDSLWVCSAKISDRLQELNQAALERLQLKPSEMVRVTTTFQVGGEQHSETRVVQVSSIGKNGRIYFKGGAGASAWASQLERIPTESIPPP